MAKVRLDSLLAERGLFESRSRAAAAVMAGEVHVASRVADKPSQLVDASADIAVTAVPAYVSRGGVKLANALDALGIPEQNQAAYARCTDPKTTLIAFVGYVQTGH